jgi:4-amino-4-deoxy-L-arabinose transferase-like glycosyltransferase
MLRLRSIIPYIVVSVVFLLPRLFALDRFLATDEVAWFFRSANFYYALGQRDFASTNFGLSVAVFTMWLNALAFLVKFPAYRGLGQGYLNIFDKEWDQIFIENNISELSILVTGRLFMVIALTILGLTIFWYLKRLLGTGPALIAILFVALDPFYIALSRTAHLDAPMGTFLVLSILAFHTYLQLDRKWIDLILSAIVGGFSFLSKLPGMLVIPGVLIASALNYLSVIRRKTFQTYKAYRDEIWIHIRAWLIWVLIFILVILIVWPAMWVQPLQTLRQVFEAPLLFTDPDMDSQQVTAVQREEIDFSHELIGKTNAMMKRFYAYMTKSFMWRTTPIVLIGLLLLIPGYWRKWDILEKENTRSLVRLLFCLALYFTVFVSFSEMQSEKYIAPVYLTADIAAGLGWLAAIRAISQNIAAPKRAIFTYVCLAMLLLVSSLLVWDHYPYYFTYYNPILGGSQRAGQTRFVGVGEGLDQAAAFLNQLPDADKLRVLSWYGKGPFSFYFIGKTSTISTDNNWEGNLDERLREADYLVTYTNQWYRRRPPELFDLLDRIEPIHRVWIDGIEYARIYKISDIPLD